MDLVSYSSMRGRILMHMGLKVKYCHTIFDDPRVQKRCEEIFQEVSQRLGFKIDEIGFDRNHLHMILERTPTSPNEATIVKYLKGNSAKILLREFPYLKKQHFWGSGLWNPSYFCKTVGDSTYDSSKEYVRRQGQPRGQTKLGEFT